MKHGYQLLISLTALLVSPMAMAHDYSVTTGIIAGFLHPVTGVDHLVALMLAGFFIGRLGSRQWISVSALLIALGSGAAGAQLLGAQAWMEAAIVFSLPLFFAMQWIKLPGAVNLAVTTMSLFMITHGWMHGVELADMNSSFIFGLMTASAAVLCLFSRIGRTVKSGLAAAKHA
jgi:urease accessory protein